MAGSKDTTEDQRKVPAPSRQAHSCSVCGKVFSRAEYVRRHFLSKHSLKAIECDKCDATFSRQDLLVRHVRLYHAGATAPKPPSLTRDFDLPAPVPVSTTRTAPTADTTSPAPPPAADVSTKRPRLRSTASPDDVPSVLLPLDEVASSPISPQDEAADTASTDPEMIVSDESFVAFLHQLPPDLPGFNPNDLSVPPLGSLDPVLPLTSPESQQLVPARPLNWAVHALPGDEADWEEEEECGSDLDRIADLMRRPKEPGMYPEHLFTVQYDHGSRFFMPSQRFCVAYLYPWEIPPLPRLSRFAAQAYTSLLPILPLVHRPSLRMTELAPPFAFALSVVGAGLFRSHSSFHQELSHVKRDFAAEHLADVIVHEQERLPRVQTLLLYQLVGAFGNSYEGAYCPFAFLDIDPPSTPVPQDLDLPAVDIERAWRTWVDRETYTRVAFLCYLVDLQTGTSFGDSSRLLSHSHPSIANLPLPASEALWNASTATEWRQVMAVAEPPVTFRDGLNALLSKTPPKRNSPAARILSALSRQSPFAIIVLSQTLCTLQSQIAASQRLLRGFATPASGTLGLPVPALEGAMAPAPPSDLMEAAATSAKDSMERIVFGQRVIGVLGGTAANGVWFKGVEPIFE